MTEMVLSFAREHLLPLLIEAANMIKGVPKEITEIKDELERIQAFINKADRMVEADDDSSPDGIKRKVKLLIEAAFCMEDVIDEYMICEERHARDPGCAVLPCEPNDFIKTMILRLQIAYKIKDIKSQVLKIEERSGRVGSQIQSFLKQGPCSSGETQDETVENLRMSASYVVESEVVGFEAPRDKLIDWLVQGRVERTVITLEGMGGQGKTTLAKTTFDNNKVILHFDCHAWVVVSQTYTRDRLLRNILEELYKEENEKLRSHTISEKDLEESLQRISKMHGEPLIKEVRDCLWEKKYVVFFDDVYNERFWDEIGLAFIDNKNGSRIFITTRKANVARCCKKTSFVEVHKLQPLTPCQSLELFHKKAFQFNLDGRCPTNLEEISSEIVDRCGGLPLAIVAIGGLLSGKDRNPRQWKLFSQDLSLELEQNPQLNAVTKILGYSYHDLPNYLKPCLLYLGMYPEDYEIKSKKLIRQWVAEGFVKHEKGRTPEVVASQYLSELINRSLVQVSSFSIDGKARFCRVHDLSREMILRKIKDLSFCHYISDGDGDDSESNLSEIVRRLSVITTSSNDFMGPIETSHIRSLLCFTEALPENILYIILKKYKVVKVLDFEDAHVDFKDIDTSSKNLGNLIHLKYLSSSTRGNRLRLPSSIGELQNLETLDLKRVYVEQIPKEIRKLRKLRHLVAHNMHLVQMKDCIGGMTFLQTLRCVDLYNDEEEIDDDTIRELGMLKQLRDLGLTGVLEEHGSALCFSISQMQHLEKLSIESKYLTIEVIDLDSVSSAPPMLQKLNLVGKLNKVPEWVTELQHLVKLSLTYSMLSDDPLKSLQNMPSLLFLSISIYAYVGESLHFQNGGFQNLKELELEGLVNLNSIFMDKGALRSLKKLRIWGMEELKMIPSGIRYLEKLDVLEMNGVEDKSIETDGGQEHPIYNHVPLVRITTISDKTLIFQHARS